MTGYGGTTYEASRAGDVDGEAGDRGPSASGPSASGVTAGDPPSADGPPTGRGSRPGGGVPMHSVTWPVRLDARRRPTLPEDLLTEAHVGIADELIARVEGEGRIVLETRDAVRRRLRERFAQGRLRAGRPEADPVADLLAERVADRGLRS